MTNQDFKNVRLTAWKNEETGTAIFTHNASIIMFESRTMNADETKFTETSVNFMARTPEARKELAAAFRAAADTLD